MNIIVLQWIRIERYCETTGEPHNTVLDRIRAGIWAAGKHYKRTGPRTLWINAIEADKWISQQPHVEATLPPPKASKCVSGKTAHQYA